MSVTRQLQVSRSDVREVRLQESQDLPLEDGQVRVAIDRFALTANNVTYAVTGDTIGYWNFYRVQAGWGLVPVWGLADVVESNHPEMAVGERLYGFFPMASHTVLTLGKVRTGQAMDVSPHRSQLPGTYNLYRRTAADPEALQAMENERCIFFPLFATSYLLYDYLVDNNLFDAKQIVVGSASSKTAFGMSRLLADDPAVTASLVGLTSSGNVDFVKGLGMYQQTVVYGEETTIDAGKPTVYVDMAGDSALTARVHEHFQDSLTFSLGVGATHWESFGSADSLPGPKPEFFFAPSQISKRDAEWGSGEVMRRAGLAVVDLAKGVSDELSIVHLSEADAVRDAWLALVDNQRPPSEAVIASL